MPLTLRDLKLRGARAARGAPCKYTAAACLRPIALNYSANESPASQLSNGVSHGVGRCR